MTALPTSAALSMSASTTLQVRGTCTRGCEAYIRGAEGEGRQAGEGRWREGRKTWGRDGQGTFRMVAIWQAQLRARTRGRYSKRDRGQGNGSRSCSGISQAQERIVEKPEEQHFASHHRQTWMRQGLERSRVERGSMNVIRTCKPKRAVKQWKRTKSEGSGHNEAG